MAKFEDVIQTLIDTNNKLINKEIDLKVAQQISQSTQVLINAARLQLDIFKATKQSQIFIEPPTTIDTLKRIAKEAADLNVEEIDEIVDKRPFNFQ